MFFIGHAARRPARGLQSAGGRFLSSAEFVAEGTLPPIRARQTSLQQYRGGGHLASAAFHTHSAPHVVGPLNPSDA